MVTLDTLYALERRIEELEQRLNVHNKNLHSIALRIIAIDATDSLIPQHVITELQFITSIISETQTQIEVLKKERKEKMS